MNAFHVEVVVNQEKSRFEQLHLRLNQLMHPKFQILIIKMQKRENPVFNHTAELTQGRKNPIIKIALIGPERTPNKDKDA
jgi:hypothetical protein